MSEHDKQMVLEKEGVPVGDLPVSIVLSFIGAPFFLFLLRRKKDNG